MLANASGMSVFVLLAALAAALIICVNGAAIGARLGVLSHPDQHRRRHKTVTPQVGGIAILIGLTLWLSGTLWLGVYTDRRLLIVILFSALGVGTLGFADDQKEISPMARILLLAVFMGMAFIIEPRFISSTLNWGSFLPTGISLWFYVPLMCAAAIGLVNAVNMADGQNGVVGGLYAVWATCLILVTNGAPAAIAGAILALVFVFLSFNLSGRIFLGDCGSYGVTFVLGFLVTLAHAQGELSLDTIIVWFFIPVMDCIRLLISRPLRGGSPFEGDRDHFHHRLQDRVGKTLGLVTYVGTVGLSSAIATLAPRFSLMCLCALCAFYFSFARLTDAASAEAQSETDKDDDNVVSIEDGTRRHHAS